MSQDPSRANFAFTTETSETRSFATITLTRNPDTFLEDNESKIVENNQEASKRFELLRQQGLNPLKPVIIANTEYVPAGEGTAPDASGLKVGGDLDLSNTPLAKELIKKGYTQNEQEELKKMFPGVKRNIYL